ncbi:MAG: penicillin-binding protein activator LpoB [Candidatus Omnitrophica bacterium]|nr:penicillin-binding protein activator LpoB [Candidatus Omnitrophota bacterium]
MKSYSNIILSCVFAVFILSGCASTKVERVDTDRQVDLSGEWNDFDAQKVSDEMIADCLDGPWLHEFVKENGDNPVVIIGRVKNQSSEHINTQVFIKQLERALLNSGKVSFVASPDERDELREEREDQQRGFTDPETVAEIGRETGANYMLIGSLNSVKDALKNKYVVLYQVNLELVDLTTNKKVWIGQEELKKVVTKSRLSL